jgi:hypothetical protein
MGVECSLKFIRSHVPLPPALYDDLAKYGSPAIFMDQVGKTGWSSSPPRWKSMSCLNAS